MPRSPFRSPRLRRRSPLPALLALLALALLPSLAGAQQTVRVATYNIKFFKGSVPQPRVDNLKAVVAQLDADVIGLQEIADRAALERLFDPALWDIIIDDDSGDDQDLALVVRRPLRAAAADGGLDADDADFLFPGPAHNSPFPNRRDVLCVAVQIPGEDRPLWVIVHHAKSRYGGRDVSDPRRQEASRLIVGALEQRFDGQRYVLLGDFNDNPDDCSVNILETGLMDPPCGPEEIDGPFLINLCEPLVAQDRVSWGLRAGDVSGDVLYTVKPGSRRANNEERGTQGRAQPALLDQILIPMSMGGMYIPDSARVFDGAVAVLGGTHQPSDHIPVYADLVFGAPGGAAAAARPAPAAAVPARVVPGGGVRIVELLPNPEGQDAGREEVVLRNLGPNPVSLSGWLLRDRAGNMYALGGSIEGGARLVIVLPAGKLPLNNDGDDITLVDTSGAAVHHASYLASQAGAGVRISVE